MLTYFAVTSLAIASTVVADTFVFDARSCNTNGDNPVNFATSPMLTSGGGPIPSSLQFAGMDGDVASHTFKPVNMLLNSGAYAVGELAFPEGFSIELSEGADIEVSDAASGDPAVFTGGQYMRSECNTNCMSNWLSYLPSAQNPGAQPDMNPTLNFDALSPATSVPCLSDDVHFHYSSSYAVDAYGTQMYNSINYRNMTIDSGSASAISAISGGDTMFLGANATTACQSMGMTGASCTCLSSCDESDTRRNFVRSQIQSMGSAMKTASALVISGDACNASSGTPPVESTVSFFTSQNMLQSDIYALSLGPNLQQLGASICNTLISETCVSACTISSITIANPQSGSAVRRNTGLATDVFSISMGYTAPVTFDESQVDALTKFVAATVSTSSAGTLPKCMSLETDVDYACIETQLKLDVVSLYDGSKSTSDITSALEDLYREYRGCNIQELGSGMCSYPAGSFAVIGGYDTAATTQMNSIVESVLASATTLVSTTSAEDPNLAGNNLGNTGEDDNSSSSSIPIIPIAAAAGGVLLIIIIIVVVMTRGDSKEEDTSRDVVAFQNPMYDSPEEKHNPVADDGDGLYDDPLMVDSSAVVPGGYLDVSQAITLDEGDADDGAGLYDDGAGYADGAGDNGGYLDVQQNPDDDDGEDDDEDDEDEDGDEDEDSDDDDEDEEDAEDDE